MTDLESIPPEPAAGGGAGGAAAAGCLFLDDQQRVLLVKPAYKEPWEIPGGGVEPGESPREACKRELREELGIDVEPGRLLCVDHRPATADGRPDALRFVFDGGVISRADADRFRLDPSELLEWRFVALPDLDAYVVPVLARRLRSAAAIGCGVYLEDGVPPAADSGGTSPRIVG